MMEFPLSVQAHGKSYTLITGASSGIGRGLVLQMSRSRRLILQGRNVERLNETRASASNPEQHHVWQYEFREIAGLADDLQRYIAEKKITIDCFVHSAGALNILPIRSVSHQHILDVMNVNFFSAVEIVSSLVKKKVNGRSLKNIVFISSIISKFGAPGFSMYSASKGALDSLMRNLAVELAPSIRVNSVLPGGIHTDMTTELLAAPGVAEKLQRDYPLGLGNICDVAAAVEFLLSDESRWVTGQQLVVDGGRTVNISI
jgi:NAD(P)-dependent dehydrogenase (short-subunit alcohol dehydrogenase family)